MADNPLIDIENRICPGCKKSAVNESGGLVVAFGQSFFHVDCFKCAKCNNQVTADTNLLLLSDGSPICADCSYNCNICQLPILDEAIMTGDDSYHAHCFQCKVCHNRIDELVFAKTSHGIYCMNCHNERMAKIRRHAQRKREKEKATRDREARDPPPENALSDRSQNFSPPSSVRSKTSAHALRDAPSTQSLQVSVREVSSSPTQKSRSVSPVDPASTSANSTVTTPTERQPESQPHSTLPHPSEQSQSFVMTVAPPDTSLNGNPRPPNGHDLQDPSSPAQSQSAPVHSTGSNAHLSPISAMDGPPSMQRRKSYDDGVRPLNVLLAKNGVIQDKKDLPIPGLGVPAQTSRADRRRSINPGLTLQFKDTLPNSAPPDMVRSQTLPVPSDSPVGLSPSKANFDDSLVRRSSNTSLLRDNASDSTIYHSPSPSPAILENERAPSEPARSRSASHDPQSTSSIPRPTTPLRSAPRPIVTLERPPQRSHSLRRANGANSHGTNGHLGSAMPPRLDGSERSSPLGWNGGVMRPTSPSHRVDVPHGVESGTDTEAESSNGRPSDDVIDTPLDSPPRPPPKPRPEPLKLNIDPDVSAVSQLDNSDESSPVERTSIATFIAPALPPIRFSMSGADFSDFLKSVGGIPSLKSLEEISQQEEALPKSPTSINTLMPRDDAGKAPTDVPRVPPGNSTPNSDPAPPSSSADDTEEAIDMMPSMTHQFSSRSRAASESQAPSSQGTTSRERLDSNTSLDIIPATSQPPTRITVTSPTGNSAPPPITNETHDLVVRRLQEALSDANARGSQHLRFEKVFVETILISLEQRHKEYLELKDKYDGTKRASEQYIDGLTVAQKEYDRELVARRNAESEIIRLRVLLSGQAAKLSALTGETSRREARQQLSEELSRNLDRLEKDLSKLKAERDVTLAEVEELCSSKSAPSNVSSGEVSVAQLSRSLTMRLDNIKKQYQHELIPLTQQRETLIREIAELKSAREQFLEETTVLNARNEELAQLSAQYTRRMDTSRSDVPPPPPPDVAPAKPEPMLHEKKSTSFDRGRPHQELLPPVQPSLSTGSNPSNSTLVDDREIKVIRVPKPDFTDAMPPSKHGIFKRAGNRRDQTFVPLDPRGNRHFEHNFQPASALRFTRCDQCGDKLWGGSHFRCTTCHINVHSRCVHQVHLACSQNPSRPRDDMNGHPPSIFGRDLAEQVRCDLKWGERRVPVVVEKCIEAVETLALDFEGIYRKTGGLSQTKMITQLFDRGDYLAFDLRDTDRFNDICSVTSVLKTYFRSLPAPLLTYDLHEEFIAAAGLKDSVMKTKQLQELVGRLPPEHYHTLRLLVLHLHRVREHSDMNLMSARNLGVVFGPTLMWSRDPGSEFSDMAGKALMIEWLVENALTLFQP